MPDTETAYVAQVHRLQLSIEDTAAALGLPVSTLEVEVCRGKGPLFFKVGRRLFTTTELVAEWQAEKIAKARGGRRKCEAA
jgi:hypothetical protein